MCDIFNQVKGGAMERQNVTLSLPKALLKKAKTLAVKKDSSLSDLLRGALSGAPAGGAR